MMNRKCDDMNNIKKCIFHVPNHIDDNGSSGSQVRPKKMIQAFKSIGYDVDVIMGYGAERKKLIKEIKHRINKGEKYEFLYSESSTMPTILTEKKHLPLYPCLDFNFFSFCRKKNIPIGLFYRDIFWKFPAYKEKNSLIKYLFALQAYRYDLIQYQKLVNKFYVANIKVLNYINNNKLNEKSDVLFPGAEYNENVVAKRKKYYNSLNPSDELNLFYVGGIGGDYQFIKLLQVIYNLDFVKLTICCRKFEWNEVKNQYKPYLNDRIEIVHEFDDELEKYYEKATLCMAFFELGEYRSLAMPIKIFEYLSHLTPIIGTKNTAAGEFIIKNDIGWSINYDTRELEKLLIYLNKNRNEIIEKHRHMLQVLNANTWETRAEKVATELSVDNII